MSSVAEQRLALALQAGQLGTWTWDMAAGITTWDERLEELHGLAPGSFGGTFPDWVAALHPDDRARCLARVEAALAHPGPYVLLHRTIWGDGSVHWIECRGTVLVDDGGQPTGTTGVALDVTSREQRAAAVTSALVQEQQLVQTLQKALLPGALPSVPHATVAARYVAAEAGSANVGGDWYAVVPLADRRLGLAIGDVAGHGLDAVADMAGARFSLRALALTDPEPNSVLERLSQVVTAFDGDDAMITAIYGVLDPCSGTWSYATAGHCPALVRGPDAATQWLDGECDPPLGVGHSYRRHEACLLPGSTLVLYTDGLVERRDHGIDIGLARLESACRNGPVGPEELCDHLLDVMLEGSRREDDVALVVVAID